MTKLSFMQVYRAAKSRRKSAMEIVMVDARY